MTYVTSVLRICNNLSQKDIAQKIGISKSYISEIEANKKHPSLKTIAELCLVFQIKMWELFYLAEHLGNADTIVNQNPIRKVINLKFIAILTLHKEFSNE